MKVSTSQAFLFSLIALVLGFVWTSFFPEAPYDTLANSIPWIFGAIASKRWAENNIKYEKRGEVK